MARPVIGTKTVFVNKNKPLEKARGETGWIVSEPENKKLLGINDGIG
jgi:hypothetical protein